MHTASQEDVLIAALGEVAPSAHLCCIYETLAEREAVAMPFLRIGLERGEKVIYIADAGGADSTRQAMRAYGIDVDAAVARNALLLITKDEAYLDHGSFDPERMWSFWKQAASDARRQGFAATRCVGETDWVADTPPGIARWMEYESRLSDIARDAGCRLLCQYSRRVLPAWMLRDVIHTHSSIVYRGAVRRNVYYEPPAEFLGADRREREVDRLLEHLRQHEVVEEQLRLANANNTKILESITDACTAVDRNWRFTYVNRKAAQLLGKPREQLIGQGVWELFPGEVGGEAYQKLQQAMAQRVPLHFDAFARSFNRWYQNSVYPTNEGLSIYWRDVTEVKQAQEELRRSEAYLAEGEKISHTGSWAWNVSSGEFFWSLEHFRICGLDPGSFRPTLETAPRIIHPDDFAAVRQVWEEATRDKREFEHQFRVLRPDGTIRHVRSVGRPVFDPSGVLAEYVGTIMDITAQKEAQLELMASEQRFRHLADGIPHHVWTYVRDGSVGYYNHRIVDYTGLTAEELKPGGWGALHPDDLERVRAARRRAWDTGEPFEQELRLRDRDGRYRRFLTRVVPVRDGDGQIMYWLGTRTDVEAQRQAEEAVYAARADLAHVNRALTMGELTASIAHELNQPLAAIVTNANAGERWLAAPAPNLAEANASLRRIGRDANRASEVIARIRGVLTRRPAEKTELRIDEVLRDVLLLVQREAEAKSVLMNLTAAEVLPRVVGDRVQLQQVVLNLVINAIEAMSAVEGPRRLELRAEPHGEEVLVAVRDSGIGIDSRGGERIFDAFFTTKADGMGMGLAISRSIVAAHGGRLWATNNGGAGATLQFTLPARPA